MELITQSVVDGEDRFDLSLAVPGQSKGSVLFAAGRGGNPGRHAGLLAALAASGMTLVAPHFDMLPSSVPTAEALRSRARRLNFALERFCEPGSPVSGVGHSIGTVILLVMAGATATTFSGESVTGPATRPFGGLVLFTPPTAFFRPSGALDAVTTPLQVWAGGRDDITPPAHARFLRQALADRVPVELHVEEEAGHFTFMNDLPPQATDPHPDRPAFLATLARDATRFLIAAHAGSTLPAA